MAQRLIIQIQCSLICVAAVASTCASFPKHKREDDNDDSDKQDLYINITVDPQHRAPTNKLLKSLPRNRANGSLHKERDRFSEVAFLFLVLNSTLPSPRDVQSVL